MKIPNIIKSERLPGEEVPQHKPSEFLSPERGKNLVANDTRVIGPQNNLFNSDLNNNVNPVN